MAGVSLLALGAAELGRAVAVAYDPSGVQLNAFADMTLQPLVRMAWLGLTLAIFLWSAPGGVLVRSGFGLYLGGALANLVELGFGGGVANYVAVGGDVFSFGDLAAALGCLFMFPGLVAAGTRWWTRPEAEQS